jgi:hypothetical protein
MPALGLLPGSRLPSTAGLQLNLTPAPKAPTPRAVPCAAGATLVDGFRIQGNQYGRDWDAGRGGVGPALGHWNVGGRWEDLWGCQSPLRVGVDAYLAASNASRRRSLEDLYQ